MQSILLKNEVYAIASEQFDRASKLLGLEDGISERCKWPRRVISVSVPVQMDDGTTKVFEGYRVQHLLSTGPVKGGLRFHPHVEVGEVAALAMWMSWKCLLFELPFGGGKGGITCDPRELSQKELERMTRRYTMEMIPFISPDVDVMAPDMGTNEQTMAWMVDTYSTQAGHLQPDIVTGKPIALEGSEGRTEATGRGVGFLVQTAMADLFSNATDFTVVMQGFGNVGSYAAEFLHQGGARITAVSDVRGAICNEDGLNIPQLVKHVEKTGSVVDFEGAQACDAETLLERECDVLIPAALAAVITEENAPRLKCRLLAEAANGPTTPAADRILEERGIELIPDILCNGGGVTVSYFEWVQNRQRFSWSLREVRSELEKKLHSAWRRVNFQRDKLNCSARDAALSLGIERAAKVREMRGMFPG